MSESTLEPVKEAHDGSFMGRLQTSLTQGQNNTGYVQDRYTLLKEMNSEYLDVSKHSTNINSKQRLQQQSYRKKKMELDNQQLSAFA
jgi:hypothetical protein